MTVVVDGTSGITTNSGTVVSTTDATLNGLTVGKGGGAVSTNTAVGASALAANSTGANNVAIGYQAIYSGTATSNTTAVGYQSAYSNTTGRTTAFGLASLYANTTGDRNTAIGDNSLQANTTGSYNVGLGFQALNSNTTASNNTAVGYQAGYSTTTGTESVYIGQNAGYSATTNGQNVFVGRYAGYPTTGNYNAFFGYGAGSAVTSGTKNTIIGRYDGNYGGLDIRTASNYIVLSDGDGNPRLYIDSNGGITQSATGATIVSVGIYNQTSGSASNLGVASNGIIYRSTSSLKYKRDVQDTTHGLAEVLQLRPVTYKGKGENDGEAVFGGLIAEEVHEAGLTEFVQYAADGSPDALAYGNMVSLMVKAIQELKTIVDAQAAEIAELKAKVA